MADYKHSPTPWRHYGFISREGFYVHAISDVNNHSIAMMTGPDAKLDADLIVAAVNAYVAAKP